MGRTHSVRSAGIHDVSYNNHAFQICACAKNDRFRSVLLVKLRSNSDTPAVFYKDIRHLHLAQIEIFRIFHHLFHVTVVRSLIRLGTERIDRRSFSAVQHAHLDCRLICCNSHFAAESIYFFYEMTLPRSADGGIAGHHRYIVKRNRRQKCLTSHPGRCKSRFTACMACTDNNNIIRIYKIQFKSFFPLNSFYHRDLYCLFFLVYSLYKIFISFSKPPFLSRK